MSNMSLSVREFIDIPKDCIEYDRNGDTMYYQQQEI